MLSAGPPMAGRDECATSRRHDVVQPEAAAGPRAPQNSPVADEAHREPVRPRSRPGSVDAAASLAVLHAAVPARTPAGDSVPVGELLAVAHRHNWNQGLVADVRFVKADGAQGARAIVLASMSKLERWGGCRKVDELLSVTVLPNSLLGMGSQVANRLDAAAATIRPAVDYSGTPDTPAEAEKAPPDAGLTASEGQDGPAWDVALEQTMMRAKIMVSPTSDLPTPPSRICICPAYCFLTSLWLAISHQPSALPYGVS